MPPSPVTRMSPGRDLRSENHKRRHSLESATISRRENDDELALFKEVHIKERDNFLLQSNDDFDVDIFSTKLRYFSEHKVEISVPDRGESSDLLNADEDKNDYDWLITPPETPLFRSLDDRAPPQVNHAHRGRPRSQPGPISRSSPTDKGQRNDRGSASPHRLCPSPRNITSPSRVSSPPPSKPTPRPRSNTPPSRRITSSALPKIKPRPSNNILGFSSEPPPNLRTSLSDRYVRGSSPASRNGSRKSRSPVASRSIGSSHSRSSVASSGDGDLDSLRSVPVSSSGPRGVDVYPGNSPVSFSRKPTRSLLSSAPRRSLDLVRQMDRKGPQNMFRPLLSNVPSSTFHASSQHNSLLASKYSSSVTTSGDASSDLATSGPHDTKEVSEQNQDDTTSDAVKGHNCDSYTDDELFATDQNGKLNEVIDEIDMKNDHSDIIDSPPDMVTCSKCGTPFHSDDVVIEGDPQFCRECKISEVNLNITNPVVITASSTEKVNESQHWSSEPRQNILIIPTKEKGFIFSKSANDEKGHSFESTSFTTSDTSFSLNSTKSSISVSVSSSVDLGFSRQTESRIYRQSSGQKSDTESYRYESEEKTCSDPCEQSLTSEGFSRQTESRVYRQSSGQNSDTESYRYEFEEKTCSDPCEQSLTSEFTVMESACTNIDNNVVLKNQESVKILSAGPEKSIQEENAGLDSLRADGVDVAEVPCTGSSDAMLQIEIGNGDVVISTDSGSDDDTTNSKSCVNELRHDEGITGIADSKSCVNELRHDEGITGIADGSDHVSRPEHHVIDKSRVLLDDTGETKSRILTLEEATDAILFCSSIVHNLAYEAANIAINNETSPIEVIPLTVTYSPKPGSERRDNTQSKTMRKCNLNSQKARPQRLEMDAKPPSCIGEIDKNLKSPRNVGAPNKVNRIEPLKIESKCNCVIM